jgi:superfamily I DNA and/or RNA helicase
MLRFQRLVCTDVHFLVSAQGTGKTTTLVEAIRAILARNPKNRVLACAPSNSAADLFIERLSATNQLSTEAMIRFNAVSRDVNGPLVSDAVKKYSQKPLSTISDWVNNATLAANVRVVVTTCVTAGVLHGLGLKEGFFSHIVVDEAGHADEPEALIPIALLSNEDTKVILGGDPKQLGPIITSPIAKEYGLGISKLERLITHYHAYKKDDKYKEYSSFNPVYVTKLLHNYRFDIRFRNKNF